MHGTREGGKGGPFLWTFGFHLFQWERRCQLGCHFEDGTPSFASFLRVGHGRSAIPLPVHLHLHARQTDVEITLSTTVHAWTHGEGTRGLLTQLFRMNYS